MAKNILIAGASGMIGTKLTEHLLKEGHIVSHLGRSKKSGEIPSFAWDVEKGQIDAKALEEVDTIINLAGAGVADKRWTASRKKLILESRIQSCALLYETLTRTSHRVTTFITASAIGYYGIDSADICTEESPPGSDFLAQVTRQWEEAADRINSLGIRVVKLRIGIVLSNTGGALMEMARPVRWWVGSPLGSGQQVMSWIHIDDLCRMFLRASVNEQMSGAYNAVGPEWATNEELTRVIAKILHKPILLPPIPAFALRLALGEMANMVLTGSKVSCSKIQRAEFEFQFKSLEPALSNLLTP